MKKTSITFGLVNIPVEMITVIKNNDISFNQIHKKCGTRIKYVKYCPLCKKNIKNDEIVKGYEYRPDDYVTFTNEEINNLKNNSKNIEIIGFINEEEIDPIFYEKSYVLNSSSQNKAFNLFKEAIKKTKRAAIAKTIISTKFYYVVLRLKDNLLIMSTIYLLEEINLPKNEVNVNYTKEELNLAIKLINSLKIKFKPENYKDEYKELIDKVINNKIKGKKVEINSTKKSTNIKNLMDALNESLKNAK